MSQRFIIREQFFGLFGAQRWRALGTVHARDTRDALTMSRVLWDHGTTVRCAEPHVAPTAAEVLADHAEESVMRGRRRAR